ncbi:universal stress protein [Rhodohalobacter mucosus]|uniref:UspA domain-containing protein n=1 Tax=Rhodohalobacter mucosus TaxID=2079485 RepID=A0A316TPL5_9BACT|nr:universal stress protein [Rhodohalobacter mucosus]PWN05139.1 hypothetical protein DDZ15_15540 [Rhodohalobacter mucosus]
MKMVDIKKILVPTDFSKGSERAYPVAQAVAETFGSTIDFIHIIPTLKYFNESIKKLGVPLDMEKDLYPKIIDDSERSIERAMDQYLRKENKGDHFVKIERKPSEAIVEFANKHNYDLILMGSRGADETKMLRGSVTERVIRKSKIPVFSIGDRFDLNTVDNVVLTTDSSELSLAAFPLAAALADSFDAHLTLFHVIELYGSASEDIPRDPGKGENVSIYEAIIERINDYLARKELDNIHIQRTGITFEDEVVISEGEQSRSIPFFTRIEKGVSAHYEIENYASEEADILIMATHGHSGFAHLILGSTAEKVAQYVKIPVITVRPSDEEFED